MHQEPQAEHRWLEQLVGDWTFESEASMGPDQPPMKATGFERVRSFGGLWFIADAEGKMDDGVWRSVMTLGYDSDAKRFVGTFIATMMTYLWSYRGSLDARQRVLTLETEGPHCTEGTMAKYLDIHEIVDRDHRTLTSRIQDAEGNWKPFMSATYRRA